MKAAKKKIYRIIAILIIAGLLIGGGVVLYMFNMPHRNVQSLEADFTLSTSQLVTEYLADNNIANDKYLTEDGNSKILEITGTVVSISENFNNQKVVLLMESKDKAGVNCTFLTETGIHIENLKKGEIITVKGVIRSGAAYDEDLELYENVILEKCDIINNN